MLNVNEIFRSIDGEVNSQGQGCLTTFIRLQGCNLCCDYCDTKQAISTKSARHLMPIEKILDIIPTGKVTITGGEPLLQKETLNLIIALLDEKHQVSVETNGSIPIPKTIMNDEKLSWIIDYKLQAQNKMRINNFWEATSNDWVKFVIATPEDFQEAIAVSEALKGGGCKARVAFSPVMKDNNLWPAQWLAEQLIEKQSWDITLNLQIHKLIWPDKAEGIPLL